MGNFRISIENALLTNSTDCYEIRYRVFYPPCVIRRLAVYFLPDHVVLVATGVKGSFQLSISLRETTNKIIDKCGDESTVNITSALDQLRSGKAPTFLKIFAGSILEAQGPFPETLAKNKELHEHVTGFRMKTLNLGVNYTEDKHNTRLSRMLKKIVLNLLETALMRNSVSGP